MAGNVEVRPVDLRKDAAAFVKSWWPIYADDPMWVPPLIFERKTFFNPAKNPYFSAAEVQLFMAYREGKAVGTIAATVDQEQLKTEPGLGLFGFFEFIDDGEVAKALFDAAKAWLAEKGMSRMRGPCNFSPNHEFGLLVDGFDTPPMIANPHNRSYYPRIYEEVLGLEKVMDWYAYWLDSGEVPSVIQRLGKRFMDRHPEVKIREMKMAEFDSELAIVKDIYNDAWEDNWGHIKMRGEELDFTAEGLKQVIDPRLCYVAEVDGVPAAISITLLDYNQVAKKMNGRLFPFGWFHFLTNRSKIDALRVFILGVKREYQKLALGAPLYLRTWDEGMKMGVRGAEASLILETNTRMRGALEKLGGKIYKTYRSYESSVETNR